MALIVFEIHEIDWPISQIIFYWLYLGLRMEWLLQVTPVLGDPKLQGSL